MPETLYAKVAVTIFKCAIAAVLLVHTLSWALWPSAMCYLQSFSVWVHECGQALVAFVLGYDVASISLLDLTGGQSDYWLNGAGWKRFIIASAGPVSTMMVSSLLIIGTSFLLHRCWLMCLLYIVPCMITLPLMDMKAGFMVIGGYTLVLFFLLVVGPWQAIYFVLQFVGFRMLIDEIVCGGIIPLFTDGIWPFSEILRSDAMVMGQITHLPHWVWGALISAIQCLLGAYSLKASLWVLRTRGTVLSLLPDGHVRST